MSSSPKLDLKQCKGGVMFCVHAAPRASKSEVAGFYDQSLKVRLAAAPADGAANRELVACLAKFLGVSKSSIKIVKGHASKRKTLLATGITPGQILEKVDCLAD